MADAFKRVGWVACDTFREMVFHNRWFQLSLLGLMGLVLVIQSLTQLPLGSSSAKLIYDLGHGAVLIALAVVLVIALVSQQSADLENGRVYTYLTRGLRRWEYLLGKWLGCWLSIVAVGLIGSLFVWLFVTSEADSLASKGLEIETPGIGAWSQLFLVQVLQWLNLGAVVVFLTALSRTFLFPVVLSLLVWLASLFSSSAAGWSESVSGTGEWVLRGVRLILPRFEWGVSSSDLWYEGALSMGALLMSQGYSLFYAVILFAAAAWVFNRREL